MQAQGVIRRSLVTESPRETRDLACGLAQAVQLPAVVGLVGPLGAGKTVFVKGLGEGLGLDGDAICSATFVIVREYGTQRRLVHVDAYRLSGPAELEAVGWDEILERRDCLIAIEWADRVADLLPPEALHVNLAPTGPTSRTIRLTCSPTGWWAGVLDGLAK